MGVKAGCRNGAILVFAAALGSAETFDADRPDFTESTGVVAAGGVQFESGFVAFWNREGREVSAGAPLLRLGLGRGTEFRLAGDGYVSTPGGRGVSDFGIGMKAKIIEERRLLPALSVIPGLSLPVGHRSVSSRAYEPEVKLAWSKSLPMDFGLSGNVNAAALADEAGRSGHYSTSFSLGHDLGRNLYGYVETYRNGEWIWNGGLVRALGGNVQVDVEAGRAVSLGSPTWFAGFGLVVRHGGRKN